MGGPQRQYRLGKRADQALATRARVLAAARDRLLSDGADRLALHEIAGDAGVSKPTIFNQFGSKCGLLEELADDLLRRSGAPPPAEALQMADPGDACRAFVRSLCRFWEVDLNLFRQISSCSMVAADSRPAKDQQRYDTVATLVERFAARDQLRPGFDVHSATVVIGALTSFPFYDQLVTHSGLDADADAVDDALLRLVDGVIRL